jgi:TP901 family phage tail tape measure protein
MVFESSPGVNVASNTGEQVNFIIGASNMAWPALASVAAGMENLTAVGMRTTGMLNSSMTRTQGGILALGGASALALGVMANEAVKFQKEMALAQSLMENVTTDTVSKMNKSAKELAVTFGEMPTEVAEGFQRLGRAGVSEVTDQITLMTNAIRMAKIEGLGVEESTKILVSTVKTFGDTYQNAEHYANTLAHAANLSIATVKDLADSLKYFGSIAREHWSIEETTAAISTLATKGIVGQLAGTSLRSFTNYIIREMPKSQKALKQLGMQFDDFWEHAAGHRTKLKPLEDIVLQMYNASKAQGMTRGDFTKVLAQFGEPRMMQQYLKLFPTDEEMETGTWEFDRINKKMGEGYDIATRYNTVMATTGAKVDQLKASLLVLGISIGEGLLPIISIFVDGLKSVSNFIANNKIAVTGLTIALTALSAAALLVVANWGKKLVFETVTESVHILTKGLENLDNLLGTETAIVAKNTQAWIANSVVRNAGGTYPGVSYPERNSVAWTQKEAEKMAKKSGAGYAPGGMGFKGQYDDVASFMGAQFIADKVAQASKTSIPIKGNSWQSNAEGFLKKHYKDQGSGKFWEETQKNLPTKGFARQESIRDELYKAVQPSVNREMRKKQILETSVALGATKDQANRMQSEIDKIVAENAGFAYFIAQFQNIAGGEGAIKNLTARQRIGNLWKQFYGKRVNYTHPEATYMGKAVGGSRMEGGMFALGSLGAPNLKEIPMIGKYMTGIEGSVARIAGFLPEFLTGLPVIGWIIGGIAASIGTVLAFHKHLDDQIESNTKKIQTYQKKTDELEKTATNLQTALDKSHPGAPGYFGSLTELNKTNRELDHMYDRIAATNREVYNAKAWQMGNWAEFRKNQPGPSWYSSIGTTIGGTLSGEKWKSGENVSKLLGLEPTSGAKWMNGPREYMFSEAYKGEKDRQEAIANLNNAHNGVMKELDEQHKTGRFKSEQDYLSKRNAQILDYNNKRRDLDTKYDRQTGKVVGPENVDATRKMYQMEERLKQARLEMINSIMKLGGAIMQLILLPLTILTGGAFKASGDSLIGQSEDISQQINHMAKQMESAAKRVEDFAKKINSIANPILYVTYVISYFVSWMQGMIKWAINPVNWFTKSMPSPFPESYGKWNEDNEKGKDHRNPSELRDNALKRGWDWIATGKAGQDIYAGLADIPNKIKAGGKQIENAPKNFFNWLVGIPSGIQNALFGPKEAYTPDDKRLAAEAKRKGISVKELRDKYMTTGESQPPATDQAQQLMQKQQGQKQQQSGSQVSPGAAVNSPVGKGKTNYSLHSPFTQRITQGAGNLAAGVATLIFPDLDPKKFKNMAENTAKDLIELTRKPDYKEFQELDKATEYLKNMNNGRIEELVKMHPERVSSLQAYTAGDYPSINNYLRGKKTLDQDTINDANNISKIMSESKLKDDLVLHKSLNPDMYSDFSKLNKGDIYTEKGFFSTSLAKDYLTKGGQAQYYKRRAELFGKPEPWSAEIRARKGTHGIPISHKDEGEIILDKNMPFQVSKMDKENKKVFLDAINPEHRAGLFAKKGANYVSSTTKKTIDSDRLYSHIGDIRDTATSGFADISGVANQSLEFGKDSFSTLTKFPGHFVKMTKELEEINLNTLINGTGGIINQGMGGGQIFEKIKDFIYGKKGTGANFAERQAKMSAEERKVWEEGAHRDKTLINVEEGRQGGIFGKGGHWDRREEYHKKLQEFIHGKRGPLDSKQSPRKGGILGEGGYFEQGKVFGGKIIFGKDVQVDDTYLGKKIGEHAEKRGGILGLGGLSELLLGKSRSDDWKRKANIFRRDASGHVKDTIFGREAQTYLGKTIRPGKEGFAGKFNAFLERSGLKNVGDKIVKNFDSYMKKSGMDKKISDFLGKGGLGKIGKQIGSHLGDVFKKGGGMIDSLLGNEPGEAGGFGSKGKDIGNTIGDFLKNSGKGTDSLLKNFGKGGKGLGGLAGDIAGKGGGLLSRLGGMVGGLFGEGGILGGLGLEGALSTFGLADFWNPAGWAALAASGVMGLADMFGFKLHSPFTVWKGQSGTMPGNSPSSGSAFSVRFPELDPDVIKKTITDAGAEAGAQSSGAGININQLILQPKTSDPQTFLDEFCNGMTTMQRKLQTTTGG